MAKVRVILVALLLPLIVLTTVATIALWPDQRKHAAPASLGISVPLEDGTVTRVESAPCAGDPSGSVCDTVTFDVETGPDAGKPATAYVQQGPGTPQLKVGDEIVAGRTTDGSTSTYYFSDYQRKPALGWLGLAFAATVILIGRWRGIGALVGLAFTWLVVTNFLLPSMLEGRSPVLLAITASALIVFVVLYVAHGLSSRTTTALIGTLFGLVLTGVLAMLSVKFAHITGMSSDDVTSVQNYASQIDVNGLLLAGIVIGSLGVLNDVTVTQASAVWEVRHANPSMSRRDLYRAGMRVGRDHVASTVYTLVLAYVGAALPLLIIFAIANRQWVDVVGTDVVGEEIVRAIAGAIGLMLAVPITTAIAALVAGSGRGPEDYVSISETLGGVGEQRAAIPNAFASVGASESNSAGDGAGSHFAGDQSEDATGTSGSDGILTDNATIAAEPDENGLINPEAYPPKNDKWRFGLKRKAPAAFERKMSRRERKFWEGS